MYIKSMELKNFGCFKHLKIDSFEKNKIYVVYGENKDDNAKNGLGKSHFLEAIPVTLYGETLRPQLADIKKYVSWFAGSEPTEMCITLHDGLQINRTLSPKEEVVITNCEDSETSIDNKRTKTYQNEFIQKLIGNFNNFKYLHYFNPSSLQFFSLKPKDKYLFVEELLGVEKLSELLEQYNVYEKNVLENINGVNSTISKYDLEKNDFINGIVNEITKYEGEITRINLELQHKQKSKEFYDFSFNNTKEAFILKITNISEKLKDINNSIRKKLKNIKSNKDEITNLRTELNKIKNEIPDTEFPISDSEIINIKNKLNKLNSVLMIVDDYLKTPTKCPTCKRDYILNVDDYVKENTELENLNKLKGVYNVGNITLTHNAAYTSLCSKISMIESGIRLLEKDIFGFVDTFLNCVNTFIEYINIDKNNEIYQLLSSNTEMMILNSNIKMMILDIKNELTASLKLLSMLNRTTDFTFINDILSDGFLDIEVVDINQELVEIAYNNFISKYFITEKEKPDEFLKSEIINIQEKIKALKDYETLPRYIDLIDNIAIKISEKNEYDRTLEKAKILTNELGWSGEFRKIIIENYLKDLEEHYNDNISKILTTCKIKFKLDLKGREKGIHIIIYDGDIIKSYGELSSAEKRIVDICLLLTFAEYSEGLIVLDEALDSLSYENQIRVINLLHETNRQIFIVSHNMDLIKNLKYQHDNVEHITFVKENGISKLII